MKKAALVVNYEQARDKSFIIQIDLFKRAASHNGFSLDVLTSLDAFNALSRYCYDYSFVLLAYDDPSLSLAISSLGIIVFNDSRCMSISNDKSLLYLFLTASKVPTPRYFVSPDIGKNTFQYSYDFILNSLDSEMIKYPFYVSDRYNALGRPRRLIINQNEFNDFVSNRGNVPFVVEEFSEGPRLVAYVSKNKCVAILEEEFKLGQPFYKRSRFETNRFIKAEAVSAVRAFGETLGIVYMSMKGNMALVTGVSFNIVTADAEPIVKKPLTSLMLQGMVASYSKKKKKYYSPEEKKNFKKIRNVYFILKKRRKG